MALNEHLVVLLFDSGMNRCATGSNICGGTCSITAKDAHDTPGHAPNGAEAAKLEDSAHAHVDPEKGCAPARKGSSARGSAEFLAEVEAGRSIKVSVSP